MDYEFWRKIDADIKFGDTRKQYYNRYLWKMVLYAPACHLINYYENDILKSYNRAIALRDANKSLYGSQYYWDQRTERLDEMNLELLEIIKQIKLNDKSIKVRIEEPFVQLYAETQDDLKRISQQFVNVSEHIEQIFGPKNDSIAEMLKQGNIISLSQTAHRFKIILRDGRYKPEVLNQIQNYLATLGDDVRLTQSCKKMLSKKSAYIWGTYFYTNDPKITTFLSLINPDIVLKIHELVTPEQ